MPFSETTFQREKANDGKYWRNDFINRFCAFDAPLREENLSMKENLAKIFMHRSMLFNIPSWFLRIAVQSQAHCTSESSEIDAADSTVELVPFSNGIAV